MNGTNVNIRIGAGTNANIQRNIAASGTVVGKCSGLVWYDADPKYKWYEIEAVPPLKIGYIRNDLVSLTESKT
jgi:hypothetical protein